MATPQFTCLWQVQEPKETYHTQQVPLMAWRHIPWINLRGFWLEQAGFTIGTQYTITAYDKKMIFTAE